MYGTYEKLALIKKILCGLVLWKALMVYGARTTPSWSIFDSKNKNGEKKVMSVKIDTDIPYIRPRIFGTYQWISPKIAYKALPQIAFYFVA